jgi:hypothetical protein
MRRLSLHVGSLSDGRRIEVRPLLGHIPRTGVMKKGVEIGSDYPAAASERESRTMTKESTCEKCGHPGPASPEYVGWFRHRTIPPPPWPPCRTGECPDSEHLHFKCLVCGWRWIGPCVGQVLGEPHRPQPLEHAEVEWRHQSFGTRAGLIRAWSWLPEWLRVQR